MEEQYVYLIGGFHENGRFYLHNWASITNTWEDANDKLKKARLEGYLDYKIYKVKKSDFHVEEEDDGLKEFTTLKNRFRLSNSYGSMNWFDEDLNYSTYINSSWKFNRAKSLVCLQYEYGLYNYYRATHSVEDKERIEDKIEKDLENQVLYRIMPKIKEIMETNNLTHIKVEFRNKYTGRKIIKGFLEHKGVNNETN